MAPDADGPSDDSGTIGRSMIAEAGEPSCEKTGSMISATRTAAATDSGPSAKTRIVDANPSPSASRLIIAAHEDDGLSELDERRHGGTGRGGAIPYTVGRAASRHGAAMPTALMIMRRRTGSDTSLNDTGDAVNEGQNSEDDNGQANNGENVSSGEMKKATRTPQSSVSRYNAALHSTLGGYSVGMPTQLTHPAVTAELIARDRARWTPPEGHGPDYGYDGGLYNARFFPATASPPRAEGPLSSTASPATGRTYQEQDYRTGRLWHLQHGPLRQGAATAESAHILDELDVTHRRPHDQLPQAPFHLQQQPLRQGAATAERARILSELDATHRAPFRQQGVETEVRARTIEELDVTYCRPRNDTFPANLHVHESYEHYLTPPLTQPELQHENLHNHSVHEINSKSAWCSPIPSLPVISESRQVAESTESCVVNDIDANTTSVKKGGEKRVTFSYLRVRTYETIMGDNPSCTAGPPLGLGWRYDPSEILMSVDDHGRHLARLRFAGLKVCPEDLVLHRSEREATLLKLGYTGQDIAESVRTLNKAKKRQRRTVQNLPVAFLEEKVEGVRKTLRRWLLKKERSTHLYDEWKRGRYGGGGGGSDGGGTGGGSAAAS